MKRQKTNLNQIESTSKHNICYCEQTDGYSLNVKGLYFSSSTDRKKNDFIHKSEAQLN